MKPSNLLWRLFAVIQILFIGTNEAAEVRWVGGDGDWSEAAKWSTGTLPGTGDDVVIDVPDVEVAVTHASGSHVVRSIRSQERFIVSGGTLAAETILIENSFSIFNAIIRGAHVLRGERATAIVARDATLDGVTLACNLLQEGGRLNVVNSLTLSANPRISVIQIDFGPGTQRVDGDGEMVLIGGNLVLGNFGVLSIGPGVRVSGWGTLWGSLSNDAPSIFNNEGTIWADKPGQPLSVARGTGLVFNNSGTLGVSNSGILELVMSAKWSNNGTLIINDGTLLLRGDVTQQGLGKIANSGGEVFLEGILSGGLSLDATTGSWMLRGGTIQGGIVKATNGAQLRAQSGTLDGVNLSCDLLHGGGRLNVVNGLNLSANARISSDGIYFRPGAQRVDGDGEILLRDGFMVLGNLGNTTLTIAPDVRIRGSGALRAEAPSTLENAGLIRADSPGRTLYIEELGLSFSNKGTLGAAHGSILSLRLGMGWFNDGILSLEEATLILEGRVTQRSLGKFVRNGGTVQLGGNGVLTGGLAMDSRTGPWHLASGTIQGGTVSAIDGVKLTSSGGSLDGVTLAADLVCDSYNSLNITNGLTLSGGARLSASKIAFGAGIQRVDGVGQITLFGPLAESIGGFMFLGGPDSTDLTIGPNVTVRGFGTIRNQSLLPSSLTNEGMIVADVPYHLLGINAEGLGFRNSGVLLAAGLGRMQVYGGAWTNTGSVKVRNSEMQMPAPWRNLGRIVVEGGSISDGQDSRAFLTQEGALRVSSGGTASLKANVDVGALGWVSSDPSAMISLSGSLVGDTTNALAWSLLGSTRLSGGTTQTPRLLEVMSRDDGNVSSAYERNFAFGTLSLTEGSVVTLVDRVRNSAGARSEALYVDSLEIRPGASLDLNGLHVYARSVAILGGVTNGSIVRTPDGGLIKPNHPTPGSILTGGELDEWTFFGRAGRSAVVVVETDGGRVLQPAIGFAEVQCRDPLGSLVAKAVNSVVGRAVEVQVVFPSDGVYRLQVNAPADHALSAGNYQISVWDVAEDSSPLVLNQLASGHIETPYSVDAWNFSAAAGQQVRLESVSASAPGLAFLLKGTGGAAAYSNWLGESVLVNLPSDAGYTLTALGVGGAYNIDYGFRLVVTAQTDLPLGTNFTGGFVGKGQAHLFRVNISNSGPAKITLSTGADNRVELYAARGLPPTRAAYDFKAEAGRDGKQELVIPYALAGILYLLVYGDYIPTPGPFTIQAATDGVYLTDISPDKQAGNVGFAMRLKGIGFRSGSQVELTGSGGEVLKSATNVVLDSLTQLTANFPPSLMSTGAYSVRIRQADGKAATLTNAFEVLEPRAAKLVTKLILPSALGRHVWATLYIEYENAGNASMPAPLIQLRSTDRDDSDKPLLSLDPERRNQAFWTTVLPEGFSHSVTVLASGAQTGVLHPGEKGSVPVYYAGLLQPWDASDTQIELGLSVVDVTDQRPMNWEGITYGVVEEHSSNCYVDPQGRRHCWSTTRRIPKWKVWKGGRPPTIEELKADWIDPFGSLNTTHFITSIWPEVGVLGLRPDSIGAAAWTAIVSNMRSAVGETMGDWVKILGRNAEYLARHATPNSDIDDLWRFETLKASGLGPVPVLDSVTDASMIAPGVGLAISRTFPNSIPARHIEGPFGYGWTFSWNLKLTESTNGLVQIGSCCGGSQRRYEPDGRTPGKYFSMPGDTASLSKLGDKTFELRDPNGSLTRFSADGRLDVVEDSNGNRVTVAYDGAGRPETLTHSSGGSLSIRYNALGRISEIHDSAGRTNAFAYDGTGSHLETVTTADGKMTRYTYVTFGDARVLHALTSIERGGTVQHFTYDARGRLDSTYRAAGEQWVRFSYDPAGTVFVVDSHGTNELFYNESGMLAKVMDPLGNITSSQFDSDFRLKRLVLPTGEDQRFNWARSGSLTSATDELGHTTSFSYDPAFNRLASFTDAKGNTTRYTYDDRGNLLSTIYPNLSAERYADHTASGLPLTYLNRRGQPMRYAYNAAGQVTTQVFADGQSIQFTYDGRGNLSSTIDGAKITTYAYAPSLDGDRLKRVTYPNGRFLDYTYDQFGRRIQMTDQDGFATKYEYDEAGRLWKLRDETDTLLVTYAYDPSGRLSRIDKGNGTFTTYEYDALGQLLSLKNHRNATALNSRFDYTYDRRGRRTSMRTLDGDWTYGYDATGQLTRAVFASINTNIPSQDLTYEYDALGNRARTIENGITNTYVADNLNQYAQVDGTNLRYDADGNLSFDGVSTFAWDQQSRLIQVKGSSNITDCEYDALGNYRASTRDGNRREFVLDPTGPVNVLSEYAAGVITRYVRGHGLTAIVRGGQRLYYDFDATGSTVGITGESGSLLSRYVYSPFGRGMLLGGAAENSFEFIGKFGVKSDVDSMLFMRARWFNTRIGAFSSMDSLRLVAGDINLYRYAKNSPITFIDPLGTDAQSEIKAGQDRIRRDWPIIRKIIEWCSGKNDDSPTSGLTSPILDKVEEIVNKPPEPYDKASKGDLPYVAFPTPTPQP